MAWEEFEHDKVKGMTGDKPIDEFALALARITRSYEDRFSRKPTTAELLYALKIVLGATPEKYVSDPAGLRFATLNIQRDLEKDRDYIDLSQYEGVYTDRTDPGYYMVLRHGESKKDETTVITIPKLAVDGRALTCEYEILDKGITDKMAEQLIERTILKMLTGDFYRSKCDEILFHNLKTNYQLRKPYPT
jgi:hypothetical protein